MGAEGHVIDLHFYVHYLVVDRDLLLSGQNSIAHSSWHAVSRNNNSIFLVSSPLFESLETESSMEHAWSSEEDHWLISFERALVVGAHMGEVEHILLDKSLLNFLISPVDEQLVVKIGFLSQAT